MAKKTHKQTGLIFEITGAKTLFVRHVFLDFNGTLAIDGKLIPGVKARLIQLAKHVEIRVLTGNSFGTAEEVLKGLPVRLTVVKRGTEKQSVVTAHSGTVVMGNGENDILMFRKADLAVAVIGHEGCSAKLLTVADVVVGNILDGLDLLLKDKRLNSVRRP